jgi:hypothetical protein
LQVTKAALSISPPSTVHPSGLGLKHVLKRDAGAPIECVTQDLRRGAYQQRHAEYHLHVLDV